MDLVKDTAGPPDFAFRDFWGRRFASPSLPFTNILQHLGGAVAYVCVIARIPASAVTLMAGALYATGYVFFVVLPTNWPFTLLIALLLLVAYIFDTADGAVARATQTASPTGAWFDLMVDLFSAVASGFATASFLAATTIETPYLSTAIGVAVGWGRAAALLTSVINRQNPNRRIEPPRGAKRALLVGVDSGMFYIIWAAMRMIPTGLVGYGAVYGISLLGLAVLIGYRLPRHLSAETPSGWEPIR